MTEEMTSENSTAAAEPLTGKKRTKRKPIIGIDPLVWLKEEEGRIADDKTLEVDSVEVSIEEIEQDVSDETIVDETVGDEEIVEITDQINDQVEVTAMELQKFKLEGAVTIVEVAELHEQFKIFVDQNQGLEIDCSEISSIDAAALQLLVALVNESSQKDNRLVWQEPSDTFQTTVQMMGLKDEFKM